MPAPDSSSTVLVRSPNINPTKSLYQIATLPYAPQARVCRNKDKSAKAVPSIDYSGCTVYEVWCDSGGIPASRILDGLHNQGMQVCPQFAREALLPPAYVHKLHSTSVVDAVSYKSPDRVD